MSYPSSQVPGVESSAPCLPGTGASVTSNGTTTASKSSQPESETGYSPKPQSIQTCVSSYSPVQLESTEDLRTWLQQGSHANPTAWPENNLGASMSVTCGLGRQKLLGQFNPSPFMVKTCQDLFPPVTLELSSVTWPKWGTLSDGEFWELQTLERHTYANDSGFWPTPQASDNRPRATQKSTARRIQMGKQISLEASVRMFPTPTAHNYKEGAYPAEGRRNTPTLAWIAGGVLNPMWVEWLMGWPMGLTDLKPLETARFQSWLQQHGISYTER